MKAFAASETAQIEQQVINCLKIDKVSDMFFPVAVAGDAEYTIVPTNSDTAENASFIVSGEPNQTFRVILPSDGKVKLRRRGLGGLFHSIPVDRFTSNLHGNRGVLSRDGTQSLYVGATRGALATDQKAGLYRGSFSVTVVY